MNSERFTLPVDEYLALEHVPFYIEDALSQLLEHKEEYTQFGIVRFFADYFNSVRNGNHILFREFSFVKATPHNRSSFLRAFWRCFRQIGKNGDLLTVMEYRSLLQLLCPDFPVELVQKAARIVLMDDAMDCLMSFPDFLYAFQVQFYYEGSLPSKADLLIDPEMDRELEKLIAQISVSPTSNSSSSTVGHKEPVRKASPRKSLHHRRRIDIESDGSNEETDSSEN
ncbi:UNVERIFIED_CONTAM: hypothetical protein FKN15_047350 [Acipenser sinensis]